MSTEKSSPKSKSRDNSPVRLPDAKIQDLLYRQRIFRYQNIGTCMHWGFMVRKIWSIHGHGTKFQMKTCVEAFLEKNKALKPWAQMGDRFLPYEQINIDEAIVTVANGELEFVFTLGAGLLCNVAPFLDHKMATD